MINQAPIAPHIHPSTVLITGGTRGLGKGQPDGLAQTGATVFLTYRWGSVDEDELRTEFMAAGVAAPHIVESDASDPEATQALMHLIKAQTNRLDVVISNVAFSKTVQHLADLNRRALERSLAYSAWPVVDLVQAAQAVFGRFPHYVIGISSDGGAVCHPAYDLAGVSKAVLETLCRYLAVRLKAEGTRGGESWKMSLSTLSAPAPPDDGIPAIVMLPCFGKPSTLNDLGRFGKVRVVDIDLVFIHADDNNGMFSHPFCIGKIGTKQPIRQQFCGNGDNDRLCCFQPLAEDVPIALRSFNN